MSVVILPGRDPGARRAASASAASRLSRRRSRPWRSRPIGRARQDRHRDRDRQRDQREFGLAPLTAVVDDDRQPRAARRDRVRRAPTAAERAFRASTDAASARRSGGRGNGGAATAWPAPKRSRASTPRRASPRVRGLHGCAMMRGRVRRAAGAARQQSARDHAERDEPRDGDERAPRCRAARPRLPSSRHAPGYASTATRSPCARSCSTVRFAPFERFEMAPVGSGHVAVGALVGEHRAQILAGVGTRRLRDLLRRPHRDERCRRGRRLRDRDRSGSRRS